MVDLLDFDLEDGADIVPTAGPARVLVRVGHVVLGHLTLESLDATAIRSLRARAVYEFAEALYAHTHVRTAERKSTLTPADVTVVCNDDGGRDGSAAQSDNLSVLDPAPADVVVVDSRRRNRAWIDARTPLVAYVPAGAVPEPGFVGALLQAFGLDGVAAVAGLVLPTSVRGRPERAMADYVGTFGRPYERRLFHDGLAPAGLEVFQAGMGTSVGFRREVLSELGGFDPSFERSETAATFDLIYRILDAGYVVIREPRAAIRRRYSNDSSHVVAAAHDHGAGFGAFLAKRASESRPSARRVRRYRRKWHYRRHIRGVLGSLRHRDLIRLRMTWAEAVGTMHGWRPFAR